MKEPVESQPLTVVAVVDMGHNEEGLVLNRPLNIVYERAGKDYIGSDGPFRARLYYEHGSGRFVAFAGRELTLRMADGSIQKVKDHWWSVAPPGTVDCAVNSIDKLKRCYVFCGTYISPEDLAQLRSSYAGCVYPYRDYERVIKFDDMRRDLHDRLSHRDRRIKALIKAVKAKHAQLDATQP